MKNIIEKLKAEVQADPASFYSESNQPLLDTLYWHYCEDEGIESPESREATKQFNDSLNFLSVEKINEIYTLAIKMSIEQERAAFIAGLKLGVQLVLELQTEE